MRTRRPPTLPITCLLPLAGVAAAQQPAPPAPAAGFQTRGTWEYGNLPAHATGKTSLCSNDPDAVATWMPPCVKHRSTRTEATP